MEHEEHGSARGVARRRDVLRTVVWSTPVVLTAVTAPAMAASAGPLTVTATKDVLGLRLVLMFSGGQGSLPVSIVSVTTTFLGIPRTISMSPTSNISSTSGVSYGGLLSGMVVVTLSYAVIYTFNGQTYTAVVAV